jgi:hypothetical protein
MSIILITALFCAVSESGVGAQVPHQAPGTIGYLLQYGCAGGASAFQLESQRSDAWNTGDKSRALALSKRASNLWYACTKQTSDPYVHDWAVLYYANDLAFAGPSFDDLWTTIACSHLNDLAYATRFSDVRKIALNDKKTWHCGGATSTGSPLAGSQTQVMAAASDNPAEKSCVAAINVADWTSVASNCLTATAYWGSLKNNAAMLSSEYCNDEYLQATYAGYTALGAAYTNDADMAKSWASITKDFFLEIIGRCDDPSIVKKAQRQYEHFVNQFGIMNL